MASAHVRIDHKDGVTSIILDRQERHNSFDVETIQALHHAVQETADNDDVSSIVLTGAGRNFCTGADLHEMREQAGRASRHFDDLTLASHAMVEAMRHAPKPIVAAVNGVAAGGGVGIALAADLIVMARSARFVLAFGALGVSPDCGATAALTQTLGVYRAREAILLDEGIDAERAAVWGLANRVVPDEEVLQVAHAMANTLGSRSRHTIGATKHLIQLARHSPLEASLDAERQAIIRGASGSDFQEGLEAFFAKRKPHFGGTPAGGV